MGTLWILAVAVLGLCLETCQIQGDCPVMDIAILGDTSRSMNEAQRNKLIELVDRLVDKLGVAPEGNHYALVTFDFDSKVHNNFTDPMYYNERELKSKVRNTIMPVPKAWGTRSDIALNQAATQSFTTEAGDRTDAKNVLVMFTDGKPKKARKDNKSFIPLSESTGALEEKGVNISIIGIGEDWTKHRNRLKMREMAGEKGKVLMYDSFDELADSFDEILAALCPPAVDGNYTEWTVSECSVTCGGGVKTLTRTCTNPPPSNGGKGCNDLGPDAMTASCNEQVCPPPCTAGLDIGILLDKSMSVKEDNLILVIEFLKKLIKHFDPAPDGDHFGFITFNNKANMVFDFANSEYHDKDALLAKIASEPIVLKWKTRTDLALKMANDTLFTMEGGERPDKPNVMIVLTDGKPTPPKGFDFEAFAVGIAKEFKEKGVNTVVVGIGKKVRKATLRLIAGYDNPVVQVEDFDDLKGMINKIKSSACSD